MNYFNCSLVYQGQFAVIKRRRIQNTVLTICSQCFWLFSIIWEQHNSALNYHFPTPCFITSFHNKPCCWPCIPWRGRLIMWAYLWDTTFLPPPCKVLSRLLKLTNFHGNKVHLQWDHIASFHSVMVPTQIPAWVCCYANPDKLAGTQSVFNTNIEQHKKNICLGTNTYNLFPNYTDKLKN